MNLRFLNTLSRQVESLIPVQKGRLGIYVCGPTVYAAPHLGHARSAVVFDVFRRFFEVLGYDVTLVRNITDIDDKILLRARQTGRDYRVIADRYGREYDAVMTALNVRPPHAAPRATDYIGPCQEIIARILHRGHAYLSGDTVYFSTAGSPDVGRPFGQSGATLPLNDSPPHKSDKRHPHDFALWKGRKEGEPFWDSPWGPGRPGWHIECTAMSHALLGIPFDIHGGGCDLTFPHHQNEIAQSLAAFGTQPAALWLHHGMVTVEQTKMAKSKGNAPPLKNLLAACHPEAVRLFLLSRPYRRDLPFTASALQAAGAQLDRLNALARRLQGVFGNIPASAPRQSPLWRRFIEHMASDGNFSGGLAAMFAAVRELNRTFDNGASFRCGVMQEAVRSTAADVLYICRQILGILQAPMETSKKNPHPPQTEPFQKNRDCGENAGRRGMTSFQ